MTEARGVGPPLPERAIGTITPSGNRVVEWVTTGILADFPDVSGHFSRIRVVGARDPFPDSYDLDGMMNAARLLDHAEPDVICWNGSKGAGIGFDHDRDLCGRITRETGRPATTSTLALDAVFRRDGVRNFALVTPYLPAAQDRIVRTFAGEGYHCAAEAHAALSDNLSYARLPPAEIAAMVERVAAMRPDAIVTSCTNLLAAPLVDGLERRHGIPVYDSVAVCVWHALQLAGISPGRGRRWGRLFDTVI